MSDFLLAAGKSRLNITLLYFSRCVFLPKNFITKGAATRESSTATKKHIKARGGAGVFIYYKYKNIAMRMRQVQLFS